MTMMIEYDRIERVGDGKAAIVATASYTASSFALPAGFAQVEGATNTWQRKKEVAAFVSIETWRVIA